MLMGSCYLAIIYCSFGRMSNTKGNDFSKKRLKRRFLLLTIRYRHGVYVPKDLRLTLLHLGLLPLRKDSLHVIN